MLKDWHVGDELDVYLVFDCPYSGQGTGEIQLTDIDIVPKGETPHIESPMVCPNVEYAGDYANYSVSIYLGTHNNFTNFYWSNFAGIQGINDYGVWKGTFTVTEQFRGFYEEAISNGLNFALVFKMFGMTGGGLIHTFWGSYPDITISEPFEITSYSPSHDQIDITTTQTLNFFINTSGDADYIRLIQDGEVLDSVENSNTATFPYQRYEEGTNHLIIQTVKYPWIKEIDWIVNVYSNLNLFGIPDKELVGIFIGQSTTFKAITNIDSIIQWYYDGILQKQDTGQESEITITPLEIGLKEVRVEASAEGAKRVQIWDLAVIEGGA